MQRTTLAVLRALVLVLLGASAGPAGAQSEAANEIDRFWPQWRGPLMSGTAPHANPPTQWSEDENVAWKVGIPGRGSSTPIVWGDTIYLQAAVPAGDEQASRQALEDWQRDGREVFEGESYVAADRVQQFTVMALERASGAVRWQRVVREEQPHEGIHPTNTWASASPATDGEVVVAFFGSQGLYCLDRDGQILWQVDLGEMETRRGWGEGASPFLFGDTVVVNWDHEGDSFIVALDKDTGRERWRRPRDEVSSWFTPLVAATEGGAQVVTAGAERVRAYDLANGELLWDGAGLTVNSIPTPIADNGVVYLTAGYRGAALRAVRLADARGTIDDSQALLWSHDRDTPYVATPVLYEDTLYFVKQLRGILTAIDVNTGQPLYGPVRLDAITDIYASPVAAAGRIYITSRSGTTLVLKHGPELSVLARNELDDGFDASAAIVGDELYLRGKQFLYRISSD